MIRYFCLLLLLQGHCLFADAPLFYKEGAYSFPISTQVPLAQKYFDQGMLFFYGFNFDEAARSFQEATRLDPSCAICYWGKALALRGNAVSHQDPRIPLALKSARFAQELLQHASPKEQAYIRALANSYLQDQSLKGLDAAFSVEMNQLSQQYPEDLDAKTLAAHSKMKGISGEKEVLKELDEVLAKDPNHPGALHYQIHLIESTNTPIVEGLSSAKKLETLVPFAGHLLHMPAHVYFKMGRYHDATLANQRAIKADDDLFAQGGIKGRYFAGYYMHNNQFLIASLVMEGKENEALEVAKNALLAIEKEQPTLTPYMENAMQAQVLLILQRFSNWDQILKEPEPKPPFAQGMWHFSRSFAYLAKDNLEQAKKEASLIQNAQVEDPEEKWMNSLLKVAYLNALAAIYEKEGNQEKAFAAYEAAIQLEDTFENADPPVWFLSSRELYGHALMRANKPEEAQKQFKKDSSLHPNKIWSNLEGTAS